MVQAESSGSGSSSRRWAPVALVALVVVAVVAGVAVWLGQRETTDPAISQSAQVDVFYLGGPAGQAWLYPERHSVIGAGTPLELAVNEALGSPLDPDYRIGFPDGTSAGVSVADGVATIDLRGQALEADPARGAKDGALAIQALVHTVRANSERPLEVAFRVAGQTPETLLGQRLDGPVAAAKADTVLSPVRLALDEGALLREGATVSGTAAAFEGTVVWRITGHRSGAVVEDGFTTTEECCKPMPFSITLPALPAGTYVLHVAETDPSGGEGRPAAEDSKAFTLG